MGWGALNVDLAGITDGLSKMGQVAKDLRVAWSGKEILDPNKAMELETELQKIEDGLKSAQMAINQAEASHTSVFVAGWRPGCGWICAIGIGMEVIVRPLAQWLITICGSAVVLPHINVGVLFSLLSGMLGLGGLRTYEGLKGTKRNIWKIGSE